ncbi:hypothetical protein TELCIR_19667 [Teladorsagia circumcincta]|uniref:RNA-directed DNA polymerase n=1 Tax=Teladorsagia circumcincta TaxID=45464 RepID=A0A2G9TLM9_TELCI|nr:hypothetical protein TELCIR_19667 [Teladorsagia circumcincta]
MSKVQKPGQALHEYYAELQKAANTCSFEEIKNHRDAVVTMVFIGGVCLKKGHLAATCWKNAKVGRKVSRQIHWCEEPTGSSDSGKELVSQSVNVVRKSRLTHCRRAESKNPVCGLRTDGVAANRLEAKLSSHVSGTYGTAENHCTASGKGSIQMLEAATMYVTSRNEQNTDKAAMTMDTPARGGIDRLADEPPRMLDMEVNGKKIPFKLDTGASISIIDEKTWRMLGRPRLEEAKVAATAFDNKRITFQGKVPLHVRFAEKEAMQMAEAVVENLSVTEAQIAKATQEDPPLQMVVNYVQKGWPGKVRDEGLKPYAVKKAALSIHNGCILWGYRVVIPKKFQQVVLKMLHNSHYGRNRMISLARTKIWFPGMDKAIDEVAKKCVTCAVMWEEPEKVWQRLHVDFCETSGGVKWLIVVDAKSKWPEAVKMGVTTAEKTTMKLREEWARKTSPEKPGGLELL